MEALRQICQDRNLGPPHYEVRHLLSGGSVVVWLWVDDVLVSGKGANLAEALDQAASVVVRYCLAPEGITGPKTVVTNGYAIKVRGSTGQRIRIDTLGPNSLLE